MEQSAVGTPDASSAPIPPSVPVPTVHSPMPVTASAVAEDARSFTACVQMLDGSTGPSPKTITSDHIPFIVPLHMPPPTYIMTMPPPGFAVPEILPINLDSYDPCLPFVPTYHTSSPDSSLLPPNFADMPAHQSPSKENFAEIAKWKKIADRFICENMEKTTSKVLDLASHRKNKRRRSVEKRTRSRSRSRDRDSRRRTRSRSPRGKAREDSREGHRRRTPERRRTSGSMKSMVPSGEKSSALRKRIPSPKLRPPAQEKAKDKIKVERRRERSRSTSTDSSSSSASSTSSLSSDLSLSDSSVSSERSSNTVDLTVQTKSKRSRKQNSSGRVSTKIRLKLGTKGSPARRLSNPAPNKVPAICECPELTSESSASPTRMKKAKTRNRKADSSRVRVVESKSKNKAETVQKERPKASSDLPSCKISKAQDGKGDSGVLTLGPAVRALLKSTATNVQHSSQTEDDGEVTLIDSVQEPSSVDNNSVSACSVTVTGSAPVGAAVQEVAPCTTACIPFELGFEDRVGNGWTEDEISDFFCDLVLGREDLPYPFWPPWGLGAICCPRYYYGSTG